jgi:ketosteroid isomerase-like protein
MPKSVLFLLGVLGLVSACSTATPGEEFGMKDQAAIREKNAEFVKAFNAKDMNQILAAYTENTVFMPPNQPVLRGKDAMKTFYDDMLKAGGTNLSLDAGEISGHGPLAYQSGTYELDMKPAGGPETHDRGKYLFILRKMAGTWRYEYTVWNSDLPSAAPAR